MRTNADKDKIILALASAIEATFGESEWKRLGYLTKSRDLVENHNRLLRSLQWHDSEYGGHVLDVLPEILGSNFERLTIVENYVKLESWLREHDSELYEELYGTPLLAVERLRDAGQAMGVPELARQLARIGDGIRDDPALAIGSAKELLETIFRTVLGEQGTKSSEDIQSLAKRVWSKLKLNVSSIDQTSSGADVIKRTFSNLVQIVDGVAQIRNLYGTGHGRSRAPEIDIAHAALVVNAAAAVGSFVWEVWQAEGQGESNEEEELPF